jgi:hypothetical protein
MPSSMYLWPSPRGRQAVGTRDPLRKLFVSPHGGSRNMFRALLYVPGTFQFPVWPAVVANGSLNGVDA